MYQYFKQGDPVIIVEFDLTTMLYSANPTKGIITSKRQTQFTVQKEDGDHVNFDIAVHSRNEIGRSENGSGHRCKVYLSKEDLEAEMDIERFLTRRAKMALFFPEQLKLAKHIRTLIENK